VIVDFYSIFTLLGLSTCACDLHITNQISSKSNHLGAVMTSHQFLKMAAMASQILLRFRAQWRTRLISQFMAELFLLPVSGNKRPPYWNCTFALQCDYRHHFGTMPSIIPPRSIDMWRFMPKLLTFIENPTWRRPPSFINYMSQF